MKIATKKAAKSDKTRSDKTKKVSARKPPVARKPAVEKTPSPKTQTRPFPAEGSGRGTTHGTGQLQIRMYRVGFGDFFLLTVPSTPDPLHVLIDCGVTKGKTGKGDIGTIKDAVADMAAYTGWKLALIIVTHRHMDHIIGFSRCAEFQNFKGKVDAIWMPAWEKEYDSEISKFQEELTALALDVQSHLATAADNMPDGPEMLAMLENAIGPEMGMAGTGGGTNAASLNLLKHGLGVEPKYYYKGQSPELPKPLVDAGLAAKILGPPPPDATAFMRLMDLKKGVGQYLDASTGTSVNPKRFRPFRAGSEGEASDYLKSAFWEWEPRNPEEKSDANYIPWRQLENAVSDAQPAVLLTAVQQLDKFLNNQSLVVLFTFEGKKLLFAGDAQAGNWEYWLYDGDQPTKTPSDKLGNTGKEVLGKLDFYKVGHHGSTNATPIAVVDAMNTAGLAAMCSTQPDSFGSAENKSEVPRIPLMEALGKRSALVRSDQIPVKVKGKPEVPPTQGTSPELSKPKVGNWRIGPCYIDYVL